ncbi:hypothetical protein H112_00297 [Trichophyton rubrum D6]|uniref:C2H2-type domain-containing protein n=4 Tax=Trichophyton TaxID=5550 RepID=F2T0U9_TRIRC|nr:uncharacterized protein TERG_08437 [Trichophyton rubrum CBS 118892]EZF27824.1 hypothetical protein H100_00298 [Trichophyton rubrum MR850]EZF46798.1 hypothetical protein H102_00297 [Trichophyton rubrum CBS 100081]EZF57457.1 hypothetical protein H103_00296 [Trichophyton rubrum CBS 288.86]EZF68063.1 hypothetical protein H104_00296 [Trichophyton rubrum CBS 289.86]EZF78725.1 hypothetical protein H105_00291 [Trichophyton soudanense CBS 452.61]EZF89414.1 hypothetical protein H110_00300 [Trichophy
MSRVPEKQRMVSILNNDDNPSFAVRPSRSSKSRQEPTGHSSQLHGWPASVKGNPESATLRHGDSRSQWKDMASSSESHYYSYGPPPHCSSPPQFVMPHNLPYGYDLEERGPIQREHQTGERERVSPQSSYSNFTEYAAPPATKKNKHACPYAASHGCSATFTTSGHAARHGKKHTGEKRVHCPVCNKAFTRKDNMKQHQRTHRESGIDVDIDGHDQNISDTAYSQSPGSTTAYFPAYDTEVPTDPRRSQSRRHSSRSNTSYEASPRYLPRELPDPQDAEDERRPRSPAYRSDSISSGLDSLAIASTKSSYSSKHIPRR